MPEIDPDTRRCAAMIANTGLTAELLARRLDTARVATEMGWPEATEYLLQARQIARQIVEDIDVLDAAQCERESS